MDRSAGPARSPAGPGTAPGGATLAGAQHRLTLRPGPGGRLPGVLGEGVTDLTGMADIRSLAAFGRRQPVALFGGAVLAGFLPARFVKSESVTAVDMPQNRSPRRA